jgi:glycosyltransferase involved in cell wall biosynthesis
MKILFIGSFYPNHLDLYLKLNSKKGLDNAANNFQWSFINGLDKICHKLTLITQPAIKSYPLYFKKARLDESNFTQSNKYFGYVVGYYNIPLIKHISKSINLYNKIIKLNINDTKIVFVYSIHSPFLIAVSIFKKKYKNVRICLIVPDLPQFMSGSKSRLYLFLKWIDNYLIKYTLENIDCFVLLTRAMKDELKINNKPFVVVEGISNDNSQQTLSHKNVKSIADKRIILYTGALSKRYGITNLLEAFKNIESDKYELWICGTGDASNLIEKMAKYDHRVKYYGYVSHDEVIKFQTKATVLVNPRTSEGEYTKYSFPSKTLEYLSSGTPTILHRLEGIPTEYYDYCYVAEEQSSNGLKETILFVCEKDESELVQFGKIAQEFVLKNKNAKVQAQKIIKMIESNFNFNFNDYK